MLTLPNNMPLPKVLSDASPGQYVNGMHAGLFYCRFVRGWHSHGKDENSNPKPLSFSSYPEESQGQKRTVVPAQVWIRELHDKKVGDSDMLLASSIRQCQLVIDLGGKTICAKTDWHFATGLGNNHPVENGFAWHPTLGVPYLTGAAVKGLLRAWCEQWAAGFDAEKRRSWFGPSLDELKPKKGTRNNKQNPAAGELIFFDALPIAPVQLKADVMTPHYGQWYEEGGEPPEDDGSNVPADWHSPVPVPFLVVASGQTFQFAVAARPGSDIVIDDVVKELKSALAALGAGAKTAAGYGRMEVDEKVTRNLRDKAAQLAKQQADASKTANQLSIDRLRKAFSNLRQFDRKETVSSALYQQMHGLLTAADTNASGSWTATEKRELADLIAAEYPHTLRLDSREKTVKQILVRLRGVEEI